MSDNLKKFTLVERPDHFEHRLFFSAKNLAIEAMMLRLETKLLREGLPVECHWREISFGDPSLEVRYLNPKQDSWEYGSVSVQISRFRIETFSKECTSFFYYQYDKTVVNEYWRGKQPKELLAFRERLQQLDNEGYFDRQIRKVNYPFDYKSHSVF